MILLKKIFNDQDNDMTHDQLSCICKHFKLINISLLSVYLQRIARRITFITEISKFDILQFEYID